MIKTKAIILKANNNFGNYTVSEEACKSLVERTKGKEILILQGKMPLPVGKAVNLTYDKERKLVVADAEIHLDFIMNGKVLQELSTPQGKRIIDCDIINITLMPHIKKGN